MADEETAQSLWRFVCLNHCLARADPTACDHGRGCLFAAYERLRCAEKRARTQGHPWLTELQIANLLAAVNGRQGD